MAAPVWRLGGPYYGPHRPLLGGPSLRAKSGSPQMRRPVVRCVVTLNIFLGVTILVEITHLVFVFSSRQTSDPLFGHILSYVVKSLSEDWTIVQF